MNELASAEIIPFPQRSNDGELVQSTARLAAALTHLSGALSDQNEALQRWRSALGTLSERLRNIGVQHT